MPLHKVPRAPRHGAHAGTFSGRQHVADNQRLTAALRVVLDQFREIYLQRLVEQLGVLHFPVL